jgi:hypothetical protein
MGVKPGYKQNLCETPPLAVSSVVFFLNLYNYEKNSGKILIRLNSYVNNIIDYSKIESWKIILSPGENYPASLIDGCISITGARLREKQQNDSVAQGMTVPPVRLADDKDPLGKQMTIGKNEGDSCF